ncbi:MAG: LuxR C-terminal-related transcriptional regulator [Anaerolineae bacterium]
MLTSLVVTKLYIPPTRPNLVARPRLLAQLDEGLRAGKRLALLSAPAGFGKTTLITEWVCATAREIAWLSLDEGDNDPLHFLAYLIAALQQADGRIGRSVQALLQPAGLAQTNATALDRLIAPLIADIAAAGTPLVLVLDDYHFITNDAVHAITRFLLENQPPIMHTVINTREDPPLPLPRLRARNQVVELRERDLRFTAAEAAAFLSQTMRLTLSPQVVEALEARTEGWIAGLQLAALALQDMVTRQGGQADTRTFIAAFSGDNRYVLDYLVAEVLQRQPPAVRDFLRQTVILDRLTAPLCDAVTDRDDSQAMLERLEAANLFLIPLDHRREWYRYHRLFAETLRPTLPSDKAARLHHRAALWYESQGELSTAIQHALSGAAVADDPAVANGLLNDAERLIRQAAEPTLHSGGVTTVRAWLDALPDACVRADSTLATTKGWILVFTGDVEPAEVYADAAEACLRATYPDAFPDAADKRPRPGKIPPADLGKLWLLRGYIALGRRDYDRATEHIDAALRLLKKEHPHWRILGLWGMAEAEERTGDIAKAIATLREAQQIGKSLENQVFAVVVEMSLAAALDSHGKRREAVALCHQAIERYTEAAEQPSPLAGLVFTRLALLHYEANQLELARRYLEQGQALSEPLAIGSLLMLSLGIAAPILYACGETAAALDAVQRAQRFASQEALTDAHWLAATEANLRLRQGDLNFVIQWAETMQLSLDDTPAYLRIEGHLVYARLLLAQGRIADARQWLARLERFTQERGLGRWLVTVYILQALTEEAAGYHPTALERLTRAVKLAAPQDYIRAFLDEDARVLALLPDVKRAAPAFVEQVVAEGGAVRDRSQHREDRPQHGEQALVEPLSEREIEVLRMLAVGASNKEIAAKLFIATGTVKQHLKSIYSKLDVHNRTEATHRAGELGLL